MGSSVTPIVVTPQTGAAVKSAVEQASDAARASLEQRGTALPAEVVQRPGDAARVAAGQPGGGQFAPPLAKELPAGAQPEAGRAPATGEPPKTGTEGAPGDQKPAEGQPAAETDEERQAREAAEAAAAAGEQADPLDVELPIMVGEGEEATPLVINAGDEETANHLRTLAEQAVAGREASVIIEQAQRQLAQVEDMREYGEVDPAGFVADMIGGNPEAGEHLAKYLLSSPTLFERLKPTLQRVLANPAELRNLSNEVQAERATFEKQANQRVAENRAIRANVNEVQQTVISLLPGNMPEAQRKLAFNDMLRDLKDYAEQNNLLTLPVHQIPALLRDRMTALGIDAEEAAARAAVQDARKRMGGSSASGAAAIPAARRTPPAPPARPAAAKPNGKAFVQSAARKKEAASIPAGGAGSPGNAPPFSVRKPDGSVMSTEEAVAAHRALLAKGVRHY